MWYINTCIEAVYSVLCIKRVYVVTHLLPFLCTCRNNVDKNLEVDLEIIDDYIRYVLMLYVVHV